MKIGDNKYKVCILAAGVDPKESHFTDSINRGILPVNNKAVISYIIEKFPEDTEIIIAVGHKKDTVVDYLTLAYPDRKFTFVEVDKYSGPGSGPGYSLLACKKHLQSPFIFCTADTIVLEDIPEIDENWLGIAPVHETEQYCTVKIKNNLVCQLDTKVKTDNKFAFIGLAGIRDYKDFFLALEQSNEIKANELQMTDGFKGLIEKKLVPIGFTWFDTGSKDNYIETNINFSGGGHKFDFSKDDEFLYFVNGRVIKFFADKTVTEKRNHRANNALSGISPEIEGHRNHFYSYKMVDGQTVYSALNQKVAGEFLEWAKTYLWKNTKLSEKEKDDFSKACLDFYKTKTEKRLKMYADKANTEEESRFVNGVEVPTTKELLAKIDWDYIAGGTPSNFHGDLQFDNILISKNKSSEKDKFLLLDWRHEFGGLVHVGDLYYDLAKLYGGTILSYPLIKDGMFSASVSGDHAYYDYFVKSDLLEVKEHYEQFLLDNNYDLRKIKIITSLIFLNMAPLHNAPFDNLLHGLGRSMLHKSLKV